MVHHVISVSIFCFLCATHSPCASHVSIGAENIQFLREYNDPNSSPLYEKIQTNFREKPKENLLSDDPLHGDIAPVVKTNIDHNVVRRNSDNNSISVNNKNESDYLSKIFLMYGNGKTMTLEGFEKLVAKLDLLQVLLRHPDVHENGSHDVDYKMNNNETCLKREELNSLLKTKTTSIPEINHTTFYQACPMLLHSVIAGTCQEQDNFHVHDILPPSSTSIGFVWLCSILAVVVISACGVLSLAIIPVMQKKFYNPLIQFLVALAVGTLAGDALLHLLPHAMSSGHGHHDHHHGGHEHHHGHEDHEHGSAHDENTWKGFVAMLGLTFFFIMERLISLAGKWRKGKQKHGHSHVTVLKDRRDSSMNQKNDLQCMDKYNNLPYCYKDIMNNPNRRTLYELDKTATTMLEMGSNSDMQACHKALSTPLEKGEDNQNMTECTGDLSISTCTEMNKMLPTDLKQETEDYTAILREHRNEHHGHSHKHGHVHAAPQNFSSVAWMVIMGDGLHNFTDGMAIGAAFSGGLAGGFSTTVAVFCHELPHELGDFAMLLKAGMTIRQALFYNILSSILCVFGNVFGLWLGNTEYASSWVFAAAAGMFIYIALVDMIPELSSAHEDEGNLRQCVLHLGGLIMGFGIMTLIALYEHDLKNIFNDPE